jgi:uncharacterized glyoxalase superfamily protein PhnB
MSEQMSVQVIPNFWLDAVEPLRDFYLQKLGFEHMMGVVGKDGKLDFAIVTRDGISIMLGRPEKRIEGVGPGAAADRTIELYLYVKDVDAFHAEVRTKGLEVIEPLQTHWWGDRNFAIKDPYGYTLWLCQTVSTDVNPPPGVKMI